MSDDTASRHRAPFTLAEIEDAIRASWGPETSDETDRPLWSEDNPARGQCASTAFVVHDLLGGQLIGSKVKGSDGSDRGHHYWNVLDGGVEVDLTISQFVDGEILVEAEVFERIERLPSPGADEYELLRQRVRARLGLDER